MFKLIEFENSKIDGYSGLIKLFSLSCTAYLYITAYYYHYGNVVIIQSHLYIVCINYKVYNHNITPLCVAIDTTNAPW